MIAMKAPATKGAAETGVTQFWGGKAGVKDFPRYNSLNADGMGSRAARIAGSNPPMKPMAMA